MLSNLRASLLFALAATFVAAATPSSSFAATHRHAVAKISMREARATALARVPGKVKSSELEREHGRLIYTFDIAKHGKKGIDEVHVSAITGKVLSVRHESPAAEHKEARKEKH